MDTMGVSERFACRVTGQNRGIQRHEVLDQSPADPDAALRSWLCGYAKKHPRWGFRRAYHDARGQGWTVNHKKVQRLWREEGLRVPQRRRRKSLGTSTTASAPAEGPNSVWATDFQFDATNDGRPIKIVSIVDEHTRECLGGLVERSITAEALTDELDRIAADRGYPAVLRSDNGPEFACATMADWAGERVGLSFIPPGQPWRNGYIESFNAPPARRMPQHQHLLVADPGPSRHRRLEGRIQPPPQALVPGLPNPRPIRCRLHPPRLTLTNPGSVHGVRSGSVRPEDHQCAAVDGRAAERARCPRGSWCGG